MLRGVELKPSPREGAESEITCLSVNRRTAILRGGVNDPTPFPTPSRSHGSHHWAFERLLSAALVPLTGAAFVTSGTPYPILDGILGVSLIIHSHIGVRSVQFNSLSVLCRSSCSAPLIRPVDQLPMERSLDSTPSYAFLSPTTYMQIPED